MNIICGPKNDQRTVTITLPQNKSRIGVFVSGGLDSAILYYLLLLENKLTGNIHEITPLSVMRKEGSKYFSSLNADIEGKVNVQGVIIYGLILTVLFTISRKFI